MTAFVKSLLARIHLRPAAAPACDIRSGEYFAIPEAPCTDPRGHHYAEQREWYAEMSHDVVRCTRCGDAAPPGAPYVPLPRFFGGRRLPQS